VTTSKIPNNAITSDKIQSVAASKITGLSSGGDYDAWTNVATGRFIAGWNGRDANHPAWDPAFRGTRTGYAYTNVEVSDQDASSERVEYDVPAGMKQAYVVFLAWGNGRYFDIYGINSNDRFIFVRRVNSYNPNNGLDGNSLSGVTSASVAGVNRFKRIQIRGGKGRVHLMGIGWTREEGRSMEIGFVDADNINGTIGNDKISSVAADKITGTLNADRIPQLNASKITGLPTNTAIPTNPRFDSVGRDSGDYFRIHAEKTTHGTALIGGAATDGGIMIGNWERKAGGGELRTTRGVNIGSATLPNNDNAYGVGLNIRNNNGSWTHFNQGGSSDNNIKGNTTFENRVNVNSGVLALNNGWTLDTTDGHLRIKHNGNQKFVVHNGGNIWSEDQGWIIGDRWTYQLRTDPSGQRCVDAGSGNKDCNWNSPWRRFRIEKTPYTDTTKGY
jgi:hypothetical protein